MKQLFNIVLLAYICLPCLAMAQFSPVPMLIEGRAAATVATGTTPCTYGMAIPNSLVPQSAKNTFSDLTCIVYVDFTTITNAQYTAWFKCSGNAGTSPFFDLQHAFTGAEAPCSQAGLVSDGGTQVLSVTFPQDPTGTLADTHYQSIFTHSVGGFFGSTFKFTAATYSNSAIESFAEIGGHYSFGTTPSGNGMDFLEVFCETATAGCTIANSIGHNATNFNDGASASGGLTFPSLDLSNYHALANLNTTDGSTALWICSYIDKVASPSGTGCDHSPDPSVGQATSRMGLNFAFVGTENASFSAAMRGPYTMYVKNLFLFGCAAWASGPCATTVVTTAPSY